ncbi:hypothetical protein K456DRAFT_720878 [Colletotrichum gloeosporioides 23]|nr:hypothetical protein K456DRAFT_720878 [Colletotrichum gloeosporioides 23]
MMEWTFRCCETWDFLIASLHPCSFASIPDGNHSEPLARHPKRFHALAHTDGNRPWHAELGLERRAACASSRSWTSSARVYGAICNIMSIMTLVVTRHAERKSCQT